MENHILFMKNWMEKIPLSENSSDLSLLRQNTHNSVILFSVPLLWACHAMNASLNDACDTRQSTTSNSCVTIDL